MIGGVAADPAQIGFSRDGELLVVTEKAGNRINTYTIDDDGLPSAPIDNASNGMTPFGFAFNNAGTLVVSEAFGGAPNQSAASSYSASDDGVSKRDQRFSAKFANRVLLGGHTYQWKIGFCVEHRQRHRLQLFHQPKGRIDYSA